VNATAEVELAVPEAAPAGTEHLLGRICILASCLFFYLSTLPVSTAPAELKLSSWDFAFYRMFIGVWMTISVIVAVGLKSRPTNFRFLIGRGVLNLAALCAFYRSAELGTAMEANIYNSSYPAFIALLYLIFHKGKRDYVGYLLSFVAVIGIVLTMGGKLHSISASDYWGVASSILAAFAVISLNFARRGNDTLMVLLFMFLTGTVILVAVHPQFLVIPTWPQARYLLTSSVLGVVAQYLLKTEYLAPLESYLQFCLGNLYLPRRF
jgi:drug/metabolite transporter (DMT)-like permease